MRQIPLNLSLPDTASFGNYLAGENQTVVDFLQQGESGSILLYGLPGAGLSHLLQACCRAVEEQRNTAIYIPLNHREIQPEMLEGLERFTLVCLDDVHSRLGDAQWEEALFHCYNRIQLQQGRLVMSSHLAPGQFNYRLADLQSRLLGSVIFMVKPLSDPEKMTALQQNAHQRGMMLSDEVASYLLNRFPRDMPALFKVLDELDRASLSFQRRLTIPFIKTVLE